MTAAEQPESVTRSKALARARRRAFIQIAELHPAEYTVLLDAVCAAMGVDPPGSRPVGRPPGRAR